MNPLHFIANLHFNNLRGAYNKINTQSLFHRYGEPSLFNDTLTRHLVAVDDFLTTYQSMWRVKNLIWQLTNPDHFNPETFKQTLTELEAFCFQRINQQQ